ncbi:alpha/beta hydrolase [Bacillus fonticola]|uniref:alpha/beta hydrolase n=1 Tax=Bacillus fonticola TaxID=2728853 RepID=UPI001473C538|nr:alpha/beta hydrolase [Bacillus fonticola]
MEHTHIFQKGTDSTKPTLLLLHGTGGNEKDLLPLQSEIDSTASVLSVRGNVSEHGMPRFFRRIAEGVFDEEDLIKRTGDLHSFLDEASEQHGFDRHNVVAIGYSNGANIAASLLFHYQNTLRGAILYHPMVPRRGITLPELHNTPVFIGAGKNDPLCKPEESEELKKLLEAAGSTVDIAWGTSGHQLTMDEVKASRVWYERHFA